MYDYDYDYGEWFFILISSFVFCCICYIIKQREGLLRNKVISIKNSGFESPKCVGADANYYNRAYWKVETQGNGKYFIVYVETQRYLFQDGPEIKGDRGSEGRWLASSVVWITEMCWCRRQLLQPSLLENHEAVTVFLKHIFTKN